MRYILKIKWVYLKNKCSVWHIIDLDLTKSSIYSSAYLSSIYLSFSLYLLTFLYDRIKNSSKIFSLSQFKKKCLWRLLIFYIFSFRTIFLPLVGQMPSFTFLRTVSRPVSSSTPSSARFCFGTRVQQDLLLCCRLVPKTCLTLCNPTDYSPPGSSVHGIF